ncbi:MAG: cupin domain-containing protein [Candidatus Dormibacteraeota bacterium]|jgi:gentisate 1,2-dioxygenase|nr:cupin domain-containing protein [Candidatus Dormibacteraeota bacterium]
MTIDISRTHTVEVGYDEFCGALAARDLRPLWKIAKQLMPDVPLPTTRPWLWKWDEVLPLARRAGEIITLERGGDRRVLAFANPGLNGLPFTSTTLWGAIQYLGPHESAPAHRHTPSAIRFVMTGSGAYTTVNGDACQMEAGDLVLTPIWNWHDHNNDGNEPMVWFDGLDLPLMTSLESIFFENHPQQLQPVEGHNLSERAFTGVGLREMGAPAPEAHSPLLRYRWDVTDEALNSLHAARGGLIASLEFTNPLTGGSAVATFACEMHRVRPGGRTPTARKTGSSVYVVFRGRGRSVISGEVFEWGPGDVFVTPSWSSVDHEAAETADLFAISDRPVLQALHVYREEVLPASQEIVGVFSG